MPDRGDLVDLFVRDLDSVELPSRDRWRPAPGKEPVLMRTGRYVLYASAAAAVLVLALVVSFALRDRAEVTTSPTPTATSSTAPASTAPATASATPSSSPSAAAGGRYVSPGLGYAIDTPASWHRTICAAPLITQVGSAPAGDVFVPVSPRDERSTDVGAPYTTLGIVVEANPQNVSPRQWAEQGKSVGGEAGERVEDVTYAGRPAARKNLPLSAPGTDLFRYFVANGGRMYVVDPEVRPGLDAATSQSLVRMIASFAFTSDAEQAAARAALPPPPATRSPEQVADGVAAALAAKNVDALAGLLSTCVVTGGENAGGSSVSREKYLDDLRAAFAAGLVVTVQARPLDGDSTTGNLTVASTWQDSRGTKQRKLMIHRGENDHWEWQGTLERFGS